MGGFHFLPIHFYLNRSTSVVTIQRAQHYSTCGVSHTLQTTTAAVTSLVPYLTKLLDGRTTPKANSALGADPTPTG